MIYTILKTDDVQFDQDVELCKCGNEYYIYYKFGESSADGVSKHYKTIEEAMAIYNKFVMAFATGCYSVEDRKAFFN